MMSRLWRLALIPALAAIAAPVPAGAQLSEKQVAPDPEAHDALELFSRLCLSTRGDRGRATGIIAGENSAIEKLEDGQVNQLEGRPGGVGWTIRMPLGEKILFELAADGTCIIRAPRVSGPALEVGLRDLLDQITASGQFKVRRTADDTKTIDKRVKYHFMTYSVTLPDSPKPAEVDVVTTDAKDVVVQGVLTFGVTPDKR